MPDKEVTPTPRNCLNCNLRYAHPDSKNGRCLWFVKKFLPPKEIPDAVVNVGCSKWTYIPQETNDGARKNNA